MTRTVPLRRPTLAGASILAALLAVTAASFAGTARAGIPRTLSAPASAQCTSQPGGHFFWNTIWGVDTAGFPGTVGFACEFDRLPFPTLVSDPRLNALNGQCAAYGGSTYTFSAMIGPDPYTDTIYSGYGCEWLF
jgi:hypothetical protein